MAFSCLRTKVCRMCLAVLLLVLGTVSLSLWYRAARIAAVQFAVPVGEFPNVADLTQKNFFSSRFHLPTSSSSTNLPPTTLTLIHNDTSPTSTQPSTESQSTANNYRSTSQSTPPEPNSSPRQQALSLSEVVAVQVSSEGVSTPAKFVETDTQVDVEERGKFQRSAVERYCSLYNPHLRPTALSSLSFSYKHHTLFDDVHHIVFCFLPKVGCTNLKLLFFVSQGLIPRSELDKSRDSVNQMKLMNVVQSSSLAHGDREERMESLNSYFKYIMVRNPLERLASGFRSKIERYNLTGDKRDSPHYNWARRLIFKKIHPDLFRQWSVNEKKPVAISFSDFISYWLNPDSSDFSSDDHFLPMMQICQPCRTKFDFYGNFNHFDRDAQVLVDRIGASSSDLRQGYYSEDSSTDQRMNIYYSTLTETQRIAVVKKLSLDLEFYYTLFPEERDSHKHILNVSYDLDLSSQSL